MYTDESGFLYLAGKERFAFVSAEYQSLWDWSGERDTVGSSLTALVRYMLDKYPALDPARVYVTGYSLGGGATYKAIFDDPGLFAAAMPMSSSPFIATPEQDAMMAAATVPIVLTGNRFDLSGAYNAVDNHISDAIIESMQSFLGYNDMAAIPELDFDKYPISGFLADSRVTTTLNNEFTHTIWLCKNADGVPMVGFGFIDSIIHCLYAGYADIAWNFFKHYSRDLDTGAIEYDPYVR